jgi:hypothetical protein
LKLYLASRYGRRAELLFYAEELNALGHCVTSRWIRGAHEMKDEKPNPQESATWAQEDLEDLIRADALVSFTESPGNQTGRARGGRHVEFGYAMALNDYGKDFPVYVVGPRENVFCCLPCVGQFDKFSDFLDYLRRG